MGASIRLMIAVAAAWAVMIVLPAAPARAHAIVVESMPRLNTAVPGPTVAFRLRFNSRIDHLRSRLMVIAADGKTTPVPVDPSVEPAILTGTVAGLATGAYRLRWQVLAVDGHITRGDIPFRVGAP